MLNSFLYLLSSISFLILTKKNFKLGLKLFFFLLPTYLWRIHIFFLPTTFLETMFLILIFVYINEQKLNNIFKQQKLFWRQHKLLGIILLFFLISSIIELIFSQHLIKSLGEWRAFYLEPILLFLVLINYKPNTKKEIYSWLLLSGTVIALFSLSQYLFNGWLVPEKYWAHNQTYRVTGVFGFPTALGIYLALIWPLNFNFLKKKPLLISLNLILLITAILLSKSTGPLLAILSVSVIYIFYKIKSKQKIFFSLFLILILILLFNSKFGPKIKQEILFQNFSGQLRLQIWQETTNFLQKNWLLGAGIGEYKYDIKPYKINKKIEIFHHPHNIFLTIWVNLGLLGLISWLSLIIYSLYKNRKHFNHKNYITACLFLVSFFVCGLVDSPYIKNDWSMIFWFYLSLFYI